MQNFDRLDLVAVLTGKERIPRVRGDYQSLLDSVTDSVRKTRSSKLRLIMLLLPTKKSFFYGERRNYILK